MNIFCVQGTLPFWMKSHLFHLFSTHLSIWFFFTWHFLPIFSLQSKGVSDFSQVTGCLGRTLTDLVSKFSEIRSSYRRLGFPCHWLQQGLVTPMIHIKNSSCPGRVAPLVGASSSTPKGCRFDPWSGHTPKLHIRSPVETHGRALIDVSLRWMFFSLFPILSCQKAIKTCPQVRIIVFPDWGHRESHKAPHYQCTYLPVDPQGAIRALKGVWQTWSPGTTADDGSPNSKDLNCDVF